MELTITRALAKIKMIDKQIEKELGSYIMIDTRRANTNAMNRSKTLNQEQFEAVVKARHQSLLDKKALRDRIKAAIVASNAVTKVRIGKEEYTVADAIERKKSKFDSDMLSCARSQFDQVRCELDQNERMIDVTVDRRCEVVYGSDKTKIDPDSIKGIRDTVANELSLVAVDPLNISKLIEELSAKVDAFDSNVDLALSESNAKTIITVDAGSLGEDYLN